MYGCDPNVPFFVGNSAEWTACSEYFESKWNDKILECISKNSIPYGLLKQYDCIKPPVLEYVGDIPKAHHEQKCWSDLMEGLFKYYLKRKDLSDKGYSGAFDQNCTHPPTESAVAPQDNFVLQTMQSQEHVQSAIMSSSVHPPQLGGDQMTSFPTALIPYPQAIPGSYGPAYPYQSTPSLHAPAPGYPDPSIPVTSFPIGPSGISYAQSPGVANWQTGPVFVQGQLGVYPAPAERHVPSGSCIVQAPPKLNDTVGRQLIAQGVETDMNESQVRRLLMVFGDLMEMKWPMNQTGKAAGFVLFRFKNRKHDESAVRVLNYLNIFGNSSVVKLIGSTAKGRESELKSEDMELLLGVHEIINKIKEESQKNRPASSGILAESLKNPPMAPPASSSKPTISKLLKQQIKQEIQAFQQPRVLKTDEKPTDEYKKPEIQVRIGMQDMEMPIDIPLPPKAKVRQIVKVSSYSEMVHISTYNAMFKELGAVADVVVKEGVMHVIFEGTAGTIMKLLDEYRFPDKKMTVNVTGPDRGTKITCTEYARAKEKVATAASKVMDKIAKQLEEDINSELNVYTFKTRPCKEQQNCDRKGKCPGYHNETDRRRCPMLFQHSTESCSSFKSTGTCAWADRCLKSHSVYEKLFHFKCFRSAMCSSAVKNGKCDKVDRPCTSVHPDTAEMFYYAYWQNLFVEGLGKTVHYLAAAIRNLYLFPNLKCLRVLCITPTAEMARFYFNCVNELAKSCDKKIVNIEVKKNSKDAVIAIGSLGTVMHCLTRKMSPGYLDTERMKAVIIDDGPAIFDTLTEENERLPLEFTYRDDLCIVVTTEKISDDTPPELSKLLSVRKFKNVYDNVGLPKGKDNTDGEKKAAKAVDNAKDLSERGSPSSTKEITKDTKWKQCTAPSLESNDMTSYSERNLSSSDSFNSSVNRKRKQPEVEECLKGNSLPSSEYLKDILSEVSRLSGEGNREATKKSSSLLDIQKESAKNLSSPCDFQRAQQCGKPLVPKWKLDFQQKLDNLKSQYDKELQLYFDMPEIHPEYEQKYDVFIDEYRKQFPGKYDLAHADRLWKTFWKAILTSKLKIEYDKKVDDLIGEEKEMSSNVTMMSEQTKIDNETVSVSRKRKSLDYDTLRAKIPKNDYGDHNEASYISNDQPYQGISLDPREKSLNVSPPDSRRDFSHHERFCKGTACNSTHSHVGLQQSQVKTQNEDFVRDREPNSTLITDSFTMEETLLILDQVSSDLGILAPALKILVGKLQNCLNNPLEFCRIVQDSDNEMVLKMVSDKLQTLSKNPGLGDYAFKLHLASVQTLKILDYRKTLPQEKGTRHYGLNIDKLAADTYNKDPTFTIRHIKKALEMAGVASATNDDITDIYVAVTSAHFNIAYKNPEEEEKAPTNYKLDDERRGRKTQNHPQSNLQKADDERRGWQTQNHPQGDLHKANDERIGWKTQNIPQSNLYKADDERTGWKTQNIPQSNLQNADDERRGWKTQNYPQGDLHKADGERKGWKTQYHPEGNLYKADDERRGWKIQNHPQGDLQKVDDERRVWKTENHTQSNSYEKYKCASTSRGHGPANQFQMGAERSKNEYQMDPEYSTNPFQTGSEHLANEYPMSAEQNRHQGWVQNENRVGYGPMQQMQVGLHQNRDSGLEENDNGNGFSITEFLSRL
ncbi:hypothetical protein SK128_005826 [Halocaridina rubra]|uniref:RRM domain-containing protein n=1 Tax=Halocaridina rubra TaxID=373956 RepID=A0AAN9A6G4_HALRR